MTSENCKVKVGLKCMHVSGDVSNCDCYVLASDRCVCCRFGVHLKVTVYSLFVTFNCACAWMIFMDFELTPLVLSSTFFFWTKIVFSVHGSEETSLPTYCTMDNAGPDGDIF